MPTERKLTIDELIEALELHLTPQTDPDHCDPCPYNDPDAVGDGAHDVPQTLCVYNLMRDCLTVLERYKRQEDECYYVKDFVEYAIRCDLPNILPGSDDDFDTVRFAFLLGAAFEKYKQIWED